MNNVSIIAMSCNSWILYTQVSFAVVAYHTQLDFKVNSSRLSRRRLQAALRLVPNFSLYVSCLYDYVPGRDSGTGRCTSKQCMHAYEFNDVVKRILGTLNNYEHTFNLGHPVRFSCKIALTALRFAMFVISNRFPLRGAFKPMPHRREKRERGEAVRERNLSGVFGSSDSYSYLQSSGSSWNVPIIA